METSASTSGQRVQSPTQMIPIDKLQECIDECLSCHAVCAKTINHCLQQGGKHAEAGHIRLMLDCVEICQTSANFMLRGSPMHVRTCAACAEVCEACADHCEQMGETEQMQACAKACRSCSETCRRMAELTH